MFQIAQNFVANQEGKNGFSLFSGLQRPASRGTIRLKSANPFDHPLIDPKYLHESEDIKHLLHGRPTHFT